MLRSFALAAALLATSTLAVGCDSGEEPVDAPVYVDGERNTTDNGAFIVDLWHEDGAAAVGGNTFVVRVAMPDFDGEGDGKGIPNANITLDAHMPNGDTVMRSEPTVRYDGAGEYTFENVVLDGTGVWQLDFNIQVGETLDEDVSFTFRLEADA